MYKTRRSKTTSFWFYTAVNYRKPILRITHLVELGFKHLTSGFVPGEFFRKDGFNKKRHQALKSLEKNLLYGITSFLLPKKKVPNLSQYRKGLK